MQDIPSIAAKPHWLVTVVLALSIAFIGVAAISVVADDAGETGCGGG